MLTSVLQILYLRRSPTQNLPPKAGTGWSHWRSVIDTPAPQVREHSLHGPHSLQPPWIASGRSPIVTHCWFKHHCKSSHPLLLKLWQFKYLFFVTKKQKYLGMIPAKWRKSSKYWGYDDMSAGWIHRTCQWHGEVSWAMGKIVTGRGNQNTHRKTNLDVFLREWTNAHLVRSFLMPEAWHEDKLKSLI